MSVKKMIAAATLPAMIASPVIAASDNPASSLSLRGDSDAADSRRKASRQRPFRCPRLKPHRLAGFQRRCSLAA